MKEEITNGNTFREKRNQLVKSLKIKGIYDVNLIQALLTLPREFFIEPGFLYRSYEDTALPISSGQTISQPFTVAYMTQLLEIQHEDKVLEIGTGSGYQAALLYLMGAKVYTIERITELLDRAMLRFQELAMVINCFEGDGTLGLPEYAPYDKIIVTAAAPSKPVKLINQLKVGGKLVVPIGNKSLQTMHLIIKQDGKNYKDVPKDTFKFVPLIGKDGWDDN